MTAVLVGLMTLVLICVFRDLLAFIAIATFCLYAWWVVGTAVIQAVK